MFFSKISHGRVAILIFMFISILPIEEKCKKYSNITSKIT